MPPSDDDKDVLMNYLQGGRDVLLWKLDGLDELQIRLPRTPTGTSLLGVVKHVAATEAAYLGTVFGRPFPEEPAWMSDDAEDNADMYATAEESREDVVGFYRRVWAHSDATVAALDLEAPGHVPWWSEQVRPVTLHRILVHLVAETHRHAGQLDVLREGVDGAAGLQPGNDNLPARDEAWWRGYRERVEAAARQAASRSS